MLWTWWTEYEFEWDKQVIIPEDDKLFEDMFEAAKKLILKTGVYNMSTQRIISFTEEEIEEGIRNMKQELVMGEGKDAYTLVARKVEDEREPAVWAGNPGCPTPEELFYPIVKSVAKEPVIDLMTCGSLVDVDGFKVTSGSPSEVVAVRRGNGISAQSSGRSRQTRPGPSGCGKRGNRSGRSGCSQRETSASLRFPSGCHVQ